jgi:alpha-tubulin suppressor-like RCC1 family protein
MWTHLKRWERLPAVYSPTRVTGLRNVRQVAAGDRFSVALLDNGTLMSWGRPNEGRLGAAGARATTAGWATISAATGL